MPDGEDSSKAIPSQISTEAEGRGQGEEGHLHSEGESHQLGLLLVEDLNYLRRPKNRPKSQNEQVAGQDLNTGFATTSVSNVL